MVLRLDQRWALVTLRMHLRALEHGIVLKDASACNVQTLSNRAAMPDRPLIVRFCGRAWCLASIRPILPEFSRAPGTNVLPRPRAARGQGRPNRILLPTSKSSA